MAKLETRMITRRPLIAALALAPAGAIAAEDLSGAWWGVLQAGGQTLRLKFELDAAGESKLLSLDQGGRPIPARVLALTPEKVEVEVPAVLGRFAGRLAAPGRLEGVWTQGADLPLVLIRSEAAAAAAIEAPKPLSDAGLAELRRVAGAPALAAAAARRGGETRIWADGERAVGSGAAVTREDQWHIGSITKSMTATLVARLVDQGALSWDDTVGEVLGQTAPDMQAAYRSMTWRHLLSHRAGLPGNLPLTEVVKFARDNDDPREERRAYVRQALAMAPSGPAETTFEYANNGYVVAGAMLETRLRESWESLVRRHLFQPLGLKSAGFGAPGAKGTLDQPVGHAMLPPGSGRRTAFRIGDAPTDNPAVLGPAGRVHLSMGDLMAYLAAHRDRSTFLKPESWRALHTPPFGGDYALGWSVRKDGGLWHNGSNTLWYAEAAFHPSEGTAWAAAANDASPPTLPAVGRAALSARAAV